MVQVSTDFNVLSYFDGAQFKPFRIFHSYYVHYSTWVGALWPMGVVTLLVIYGGSQFISWIDNPNLEDTSIFAISDPPAGFGFIFPETRVQFYLRDAADGSQTTFYNESYFRIEWQLCNEARSYSPTATEYDIGNLTSALSGYLINSTALLDAAQTQLLPTFSSIVDFSQTCRTLYAVPCSSGTGICPLLPASLSLSSTDASFQYVIATVRKCVGSPEIRVPEAYKQPGDDCSAANSTNTTTFAECLRRPTCLTPGAIDAMLSGGKIVIHVGDNQFAEQLQLDTQEEKIRFNSSYFFPYDSRYVLRPRILFQAQHVLVLSAYFANDDNYYYVEPTKTEIVYGPTDSLGIVMDAVFQLEPSLKKTRILPVSVFNMIARFGQVVAAVAIGNWFIRRFNFFSFFAVADENYYVPDINVRKFLLANRKTRLKEFEDQLMFALSFGSCERFGVQTRHIYEFFKDRNKRFDRKETQAIVEDIQKHTTSKRIGGFISEEEKKKGEVESNYDVSRINNEKVSKGRLSKVQAAMNKRADEIIEDDDPGASVNKDAVIREVETSLKLCVIQDELNKMKVLAATMFPQQAKKERLAEKLNGTVKA